MKCIITKFLIMVIMVFATFQLSAAQTTIILNKTEDPVEPSHKDIPDYGHRMPSAPFLVTIDDAGVIIPGVSKDEVVSYSIYDVDGLLVGLYIDDVEFASALLSMEETVEIRIELADYALCGWAHL